MRLFPIYIFLSLFSFNAFAQNALNCAELNPDTYFLCENFNDGNFTENPTWSGDTADWIIADGQLQSNGPAITGTLLQLTTPSTAINNTEWQFFANPRLSTSSNNYMDIFLVSDTNNLKETPNGYFVRIGDTSDDVSLFRIDNGEETKIINGLGGTIGSSTNNPVSVKVTRTAEGLWTLQTAIGGGSIFSIEGTATDLTHTNSTHFGVLIRYSQTNAAKFFFDDFFVGDIVVDTQAPEIVSANAISSTVIEVVFNEAVSAETSEDENNYLLNNSETPSMASLVNPTLVRLNFDTPLQSSVSNELQISNIADLAGNEIETTTRQIAYFEAQENDIIISEFFPDPAPPVGLPEFEFVELYNRSDFDIPLANWTISDASTSATLPPITLPSKSYLIVCAQGTVATAYQPFGNVATVSSLPSLNNTSDELTLTSNTGLTINQVNYSSSWYRDDMKNDGGWTLEIINPENLCETANNWIASLDAKGGTPGQANSVLGLFPDNEAPKIVSANLDGDQAIEVTFDEAIDLFSASNPSNYSLNNGIGVQSVVEDLQMVTLFLDSPLQQGTLYTLTINGIEDCVGNVGQNLQIQLAIPQAADIFDVLINEIYTDFTIPEVFNVPQLNLPESEFVELYNRSDKTINLGGWYLGDSGDSTVLGNYLLLPKQYVVLCPMSKVADFLALGAPTLGVTGFPSLTNSGETITLLNPSQNLIHTVSYQDFWYRDEVKQEGGWTLEMIDPANPCEGANNWRASNATIGGTPGLQNSIFATNPDQTFPDLLRAEAITATQIQLFFSETLNPNNATNLSYFNVSDGIGQPIIALLQAPNFNSVLLLLANPLQQDQIYTMTVQGITDCAGNAIGGLNQVPLGIAKAPEVGDLVINEILFNPVSGGVDFVEIYNKSNKIIQLFGWLLANVDIEENPDSLINVSPIVEERYSLYPNQYLVLTENVNQVRTYYGRCNNLPMGSFLTADLPTYDDREGVVAITEPFRTIVLDQVHYFADWHYSLLRNENGVSLERIDVNAPSQDPNNWQSAAEGVCFATPGYQNSQFFAPTDSGKSISIEPSSFSPDGDGFKDFTTIQYEFDQPGFVLNISIFDSRGQEVRQLVQSELAGNSGSFKWDGILENGEKARLGIYIVFVEAYDLEGNREVWKETVVVGGRLK
ncbi:MAG: lamin tail domain-containing protein [Chitinophagales bacterium]